MITKKKKSLFFRNVFTIKCTICKSIVHRCVLLLTTIKPIECSKPWNMFNQVIDNSNLQRFTENTNKSSCSSRSPVYCFSVVSFVFFTLDYDFAILVSNGLRTQNEFNSQFTFNMYEWFWNCFILHLFNSQYHTIACAIIDKLSNSMRKPAIYLVESFELCVAGGGQRRDIQPQPEFHKIIYYY